MRHMIGLRMSENIQLPTSASGNEISVKESNPPANTGTKENKSGPNAKSYCFANNSASAISKELSPTSSNSIIIFKRPCVLGITSKLMFVSLCCEIYVELSDKKQFK